MAANYDSMQTFYVIPVNYPHCVNIAHLLPFALTLANYLPWS